MYTDSAGGNLSAYQVQAYEEFPLLMPRWGYLLSAFVLFLIGFFGFFLNLLVILLMFKDRQLWTPLNIILFNLVCSDFSVSVLGNPFTLTSAIYHRWIFGEHMCVLYGFFMALLGITSITTLTVLSFERYVMVSRPFSSRHLTRRGACITIFLIWVYSLAVTSPPLLFGWGKYVNEAANISCSVNWEEQTTNALTYILFLFGMGQVIPCAVIGFSYYNILKTMRKNAKRMGRVNRAETKVTVMVFVMIVAFMVAWTPYSILALLEQFGEHGMVSPGVGVMPALIAKSSICYNPLIYVGMNTQYRTSIKRMFGIHSKDTTDNDECGYEQTMVSDSGSRFNCNGIRVKLDVSAKTIKTQKNQSSGKQVSIAEGAVKKGNYDVYSSTDKKTSTTDTAGTDHVHRIGNSEMASLAFIRKKKNPNNSKIVYKNRAFESTMDEEININETEVRKQPRRNSLNDKFDLEIEKPKKPLKTSSSLEMKCVMLDPTLRKKSIIDDRNKSISNSMVIMIVDSSKRWNSENFKIILSDQGDNEENCL